MLPLDIIVPTQMQLDRIILNQTRLQINMRPVYTDIELYREIENQRISARNYRDNLNGLHYVNHGRNASNFHEEILLVNILRAAMRAKLSYLQYQYLQH